MYRFYHIAPAKFHLTFYSDYSERQPQVNPNLCDAVDRKLNFFEIITITSRINVYFFVSTRSHFVKSIFCQRCSYNLRLEIISNKKNLPLSGTTIDEMKCGKSVLNYNPPTEFCIISHVRFSNGAHKHFFFYVFAHSQFFDVFYSHTKHNLSIPLAQTLIN